MNAHHIKYMKMALLEAEAARAMDEVPVGALIVDEVGRVVAQAHNRTVGDCDPSAHAEMLAIRSAARKMENYRLLGTTLYATVEPCVMCMGAAVHARVERIVFGAPDPRWGAAGSLYDFHLDTRLNHRPEIIGGVCMEECRQMIKDFFIRKR